VDHPLVAAQGPCCGGSDLGFWRAQMAPKASSDVPDDPISEMAAAAILGVSHQQVNQIRDESKLEPIKAAGLGRTRTLYRRSEVELLRVERGVGRCERPSRNWTRPSTSRDSSGQSSKAKGEGAGHGAAAKPGQDGQHQGRSRRTSP
jgi:hypothetical protein